MVLRRDDVYTYISTNRIAIMTDMYDEKKIPDFNLPPYQHEDHGAEVSFACVCVVDW